MTNTHSFGLWVKAARKTLDLTQKDLADRVGCSTVTIKQIEAETRRPSRQLVELLATHLNIPTAQRTQFMALGRGGSGKQHVVLPQQWTPLVGREAELAKITELVQMNSTCHLLTLVGPGGIGKTRLAIEAARSLLDNFADGVYFVSLAGINSIDFLIPTIAEVLQLSNGMDSVPQLIGYFQEKSALLILDNFEHLIEGHQLLSEIVRGIPAVKILVTSRERLNIQEEWVFDVPGLDIPQQPDAPDVQDYSAVKLFVQQAQKVAPSFVLGKAERDYVIRSCQLVGGMPLAIELAAAWVRTQSCQAIMQGLEQGLDILTASGRNYPERHRSVRRVLDQSWDLLTAQEQRILAKLSVFCGGFDLSAAEYVTDCSASILGTLIDKSFLHKTPADRYDFHEMVRQYARQKLDTEIPFAELIGDKHSGYFLRFVTTQSSALRSKGQTKALNEIAHEMDNIRAAWQWATEHHRLEYLEQATESLLMFYEIRGWYREGEKLFRDTICELRTIEPTMTDKKLFSTLLGRMLGGCYGWCLLRLGAYAQAKAATEESLSLLNPQDQARDWGISTLALGTAQIWLGEFIEASQHLYESSVIFEQVGDPWMKAVTLQIMGVVMHNVGVYSEAERMFVESIELFKAMDDGRMLAICKMSLGATLIQTGEYENAERLIKESLAWFRKLDDRMGIATSLRAMGGVAFSKGDIDKASRLFEEALMLAKENGELEGVASTQTYLGDIARLQGNYERARLLLQESMEICNATHNHVLRIETLIGLGNLLCAQGAYDQSQTYFYESLDLAIKNQAPSLTSHGLLGLATLFIDTQRHVDAVEILRALIERDLIDLATKTRASELLHSLNQMSPSLAEALNTSSPIEAIAQKLLERLSANGHEGLSRSTPVSV